MNGIMPSVSIRQQQPMDITQTIPTESNTYLAKKVKKLSNAKRYVEINDEIAIKKSSSYSVFNILYKFIKFIVFCVYFPVAWLITKIVKFVFRMDIRLYKITAAKEDNNKIINKFKYNSKGNANIYFNGAVKENGKKYTCRHLADGFLHKQLDIKNMPNSLEEFKKNQFFNNQKPIRSETNDNKILTRYEEIESYLFADYLIFLNNIFDNICNKITNDDIKEVINILVRYDYCMEANKLTNILNNNNGSISEEIYTFLNWELKNSYKYAYNLIISFLITKYLTQGYLIDSKSSDNNYYFSINSFSDLLFELCKSISSKPLNHEYRFRFVTPTHVMVLILKSKPRWIYEDKVV